MDTILSIKLLGRFQLMHGDAPITTIRSPRQQALLAYLLMHRDAPQSRAHLAFVFWPDSTEGQARTNLRKQVHHLRRHLPGVDRLLHVDAQTVQWLPDAPYTLDVSAFEDALRRAKGAAQAGSQVAENEALQQASALYHGDLLPGCYDDWILAERERLRQALLRALERLVALTEGQRDYARAIDCAQRLQQLDPLYEAGYRNLMRLYAVSGDRGRALQTYHTCVETLQRELGVSPSPATREAYERLSLSGVRAPPARSTAPLPLVGRECEWALLQTAWRAAMDRGPRFALVAGDAGIGKTRLVEELVQWAHRQGVDVAVARCYAAGGRLAYAPAVAWLRARPLPDLAAVWRRELSRLLPELLAQEPGMPPPFPMAEAWQRQHLFEALARAILGHGGPLLLALDDIQWCDSETLGWLHYLLRTDHRARVLVVATLSYTAGQDHPESLRALTYALRHDDLLTEVELGPLDRSSTASLAAHVLGREIEPDTAATLYQETEGNPLFVVELVNAGLPPGKARPETPRRALPPRMRAAIEARLAQLSPVARDVAGLAATIGREFAFDVLAHASGLGQEALVHSVDELWQGRVIREQVEDRYDFAHDKLREAAYEGQSAAKRRLYHLHVAQALETLRADEVFALGAQLARHYDRAGRPGKAIHHYRAAAAMVGGVLAHDQAIRHLERALALTAALAPDREGQQERLDLLVILMRRTFEAGQVAEAEAHLCEALALGEAMALPPRRLSRMLYWLGELMHWQGRLDDQVRAGERGLALLRGDRESVEAALMERLIAVGRGNTPNTIGLPDPAQDRPDGTILERRLWYAVFEINTAYV